MEAIKKVYYTSKEIGDIIGESDSCIRHWRDQFELPTVGSKKKFTRNTSLVIFKIKRLLRKDKYTIEGAKIQLRKAKLI